MPGTIHSLFAEEDESYSDLETLLDAADSYDESDDDSWDESWDERAPKRFNPRANTRFVSRGTPRFRPSPALSGARIGGGAGGSGQVKFAKPVATAQAIEQLKTETRKAIAEVRAETKTNLGRLDDRLKSTATQVDKLGKTVSASTARVSALESRSQLFALLPFIQGKPKPTKIKFKDETEKTVDTVAYEDNKMDMMLPLVLMGGLGGGTPGSQGGQDQNMMMLMAVMLMQ